MARWKSIERLLCRIFNGERSGPVGKDGSDCRGTEPFAIQVKHGKQIPKGIQKFMAQTVRDAPKGTLPTLLMHAHGAPIEETLVVFRLGDYRVWYL